MKHSDMHTFFEAFNAPHSTQLSAHKSELRKELIKRAVQNHAEYRIHENSSSFITNIRMFMKNIKTVGVTAAIATIYIMGTIFAPNVLAYKAVYDGLDTVTTLENQHISEVYSVSIDNFEDILTTAKKSADLKIISKEEAEKSIEKSDISMGKTTSLGSGMKLAQESGVGTGNAQDSKSSIVADVMVDAGEHAQISFVLPDNIIPGTMTTKQTLDSRIVKFISFTNSNKEKVIVGLDKDSLPILMAITK